ncbi:hypothetical protein P4S72_03400 [Vibrio sp. PP-XX7]
MTGNHNVALSQQLLEKKIIDGMVAQGANASGDYSWVQKMAQVISTGGCRRNYHQCESCYHLRQQCR